MFIEFCKSKIAHARVTQAELHYEGSITIDDTLLKAVNIIPGEKVHVLNVNTGARIETYAIRGEAGSGIICLNGPAARHGYAGDELIILSYAFLSPTQAKKAKMKVVNLDKHNRIKTK